MNEDQGLASVEFVEHRCESRIAGIRAVAVGHQLDAGRSEHIEGIIDLGEARVDIGQRKDREHPEAARMIAPKLCRIFVAAARQRLRFLDVAEPETRRPERGDGPADAVAVHHVERNARRPGRRAAAEALRAEAVSQGLGEHRRQDVMSSLVAYRVRAAIAHSVYF